MTYKTKLFNSLHLTRDAQAAASEHDDALVELMANPEYLRHSSAVIHEALKDGFDVLQLPNGDIVTTGTKIITNTYVWDAKGAKLVKARVGADKAPAKPRARKVEVAADVEEDVVAE